MTLARQTHVKLRFWRLRPHPDSARVRCLRTTPILQALLSYVLGMDTNNELHRLGLEPLLDISELASYLGVPVSTIYDWRSRGVGPRAYRFGKHLKFAVTDVTAWIEAQRGADPTTAALLEKAFGR